MRLLRGTHIISTRKPIAIIASFKHHEMTQNPSNQQSNSIWKDSKSSKTLRSGVQLTIVWYWFRIYDYKEGRPVVLRFRCVASVACVAPMMAARTQMEAMMAGYVSQILSLYDIKKIGRDSESVERKMPQGKVMYQFLCKMKGSGNFWLQLTFLFWHQSTSNTSTSNHTLITCPTQILWLWASHPLTMAAATILPNGINQSPKLISIRTVHFVSYIAVPLVNLALIPSTAKYEFSPKSKSQFIIYDKKWSTNTNFTLLVSSNTKREVLADGSIRVNHRFQIRIEKAN